MSQPEKVNFLGVEFEVVNYDTLMAQTNGTGAHTLMVTRVVDCDDRLIYPALAARRFKIRCHVCREVCWIDPMSSPAPGLARIVCVQCLLEELEKRNEDRS